MKSMILWALVALNVLLLIGFVSRYTGENQAMAQVRRPAEYIMIPGNVLNTTAAVIYVIDTTNGQLGALSFDDARSELDVMPPIDLNRLFEAGASATGTGAGGRTGTGRSR
jgi:hypothetical protein